MTDWAAAWEVVCILSDAHRCKLADWEKAEEAYHLLDMVDPSRYAEDMRTAGRDDLADWLEERRDER